MTGTEPTEPLTHGKLRTKSGETADHISNDPRGGLANSGRHARDAMLVMP
jgi:hypothetical protein